MSTDLYGGKMKKKILILTGSPRKKGNSNTLTKAFIEGAREKGHEVTTFDTAAKKINGCKACNTCWRKGKACSFEDDNFNELAELLKEADIVVFSTPLYWGSFSGQLKNAIDKIYSFTVEPLPVPLKKIESILLATAADEEKAFEGLIRQFEYMNDHLKWNVKGTLTVANVYEIGDINSTEGLKEAYKMAFEL